MKSNKGNITNIFPYLKDKISIDEFKIKILAYIFKTDNFEKDILHLSEEDFKKINILKEEKYYSWDWNYGKNPKYTFTKERRFLGGNILFNMEIKKEIILGVKIYGDFLGRKDAADLEKILKGKKFDKEELYNILKEENVDEFFYNISVDNIIDCLFN